MSACRPTRLIAGLAVVAMAVSGCGGGSDGPKATTTTAPVVTTVPPPGQLQLGMIVVQPSDLPSGWTAKAPSAPRNPEALPTAFSECVGTAVTANDVNATAYSHTYVMGTDVITSNATSFKTRTDVPADTSALDNPKAPACLQQAEKAAFAALLPAGVTVRNYSVKLTPGDNGVAPNVVAIADTTVTYAEKGHALTLTGETVDFSAPRIEAQVTFFNVGTPITVATKAAVLNKVAARVLYGS